MTRLRRFVRWSASGMAAILVLLVIGVAVLQTAWFKNWLRLQLVAQAGSFLDADLRVGRLSGSLWTGVTLDDVELWDRRGRVLKAEHVRLRYHPMTLARRQWVFDHVVIDHASVDLVQSPQGWNILRLARPRAPGGAPMTLAIRRIEVSDSTVTIATAGGDKRTLSGVDLDAALTVSAGTATLTIAALRAHDSVTDLTLRQLSGSASDNFRMFNATFVADSQTMRLAGSVHGDTSAGTRRVTATLDAAHADLARLTGRPHLATDITGRLEAQATLPAENRDVRITFAFSGPSSTAFGYTVNHIDASGHFTPSALTFQARVSAYDARATVDGTVQLARNSTPSGFTGRGTFASVNITKLPASLHLPRLDSDLSGRFDATVDARGWRARATLTRAVVEGATLASGTVASLDVAGGATAYDATGRVAHLDVQRLGRALPVQTLTAAQFASDLSGAFSVSGHTGARAPQRLVGRAELENSVVSGTRLPAFTASVDLAGRRLAISAKGKFEGLNEHTLGGGLAIAATGSVDGWLTIPDLDRPLTEANLEAGGRLDLAPSSIGGVPIESAVVDGDLAGGIATLRALDVRHPGASVHAEGALSLHEPAAAKGLIVSAEIHDPSFLKQTLDWPASAVGSLDATITGTAESPSATGSLALRQLAFREVASALTMTTQFGVEWPGRQVDALQWRIDGGAAFATIGGAEIGQITAKAGGGLREMTVDIKAVQPTRSLNIEGQVTLDADARQLRLRRVALTTQNVEWSLPTGQAAVIRYAGDRVEVTGLTLVRANQQILIEGGVDLAASAGSVPAARPGLELQIHDVELADVNHLLLGTRRLTGQINGTVTINGTRQSPVVDAEVVIRNGAVEGVPYESLRARGQYANHQASLDVLLEQAPGSRLHAVGTVPIGATEPEASMDVRLTGGPVSLALVQALTTEVDNVQGTAALDLRVTGSLRGPLVNGTATIANGALDLRATGVRYQAIEAALDFAGSHVAIRQLQLADANGDLITASGGLDVLGEVAGRAIDVHVRAANVSLLNNRFGTADMDADLRVSGTLGALVVRGTATLESGRLEVAQILERTTARPYSTEPAAAAGALAPAQPRTPLLLDRADIAVQVRLPDNLVLRGRDLRVSNGGFGIGDMNIVVGGSFDVTRPPGEDVSVAGTLEVVRGSYSFQGRRFEIERGSDLRFRPGAPADPYLNVNATREVSGITAEVRLRGTAQSPELTLTSRPPLDEGDVLSLIVFNQPINALGSAARANLGERAASIAAGAVMSPLADSIAQALNLDLVEIQAPTVSQSAGSVTVGSQIGSRIFVGLRQQFGHDEGSLFTLEYRINKMLRFVTSIARGTLEAHATRRVDRGGVDLIFMIRY